MNPLQGKDKDFQGIANEYHNYLDELNQKNSKFRKELPDEYCRKIYDALFLEAEKNRYELKFTEIRTLTGMTRPTLSLHLKHLEEKGFVKKRVETKYKTAYKINLIRVIKVCKIKKTITGKEKLELTDITKIGVGDRFIPMAPFVPIPKNDSTPVANNKKAKTHFKAHKNKQ